MSGCSDIRARVQMSRHLSRFIFDIAPPENQAFIEKIIATNSARATRRARVGQHRPQHPYTSSDSNMLENVNINVNIN
eukprot:5658333-Prymnesium_polylepis.1